MGEASVLEWLTDTAVARALTASATLYIFANAAHIFSVGLLVGSIIPLDLRILGLFGKTPLGVLGPFLSRTAMAGAALSIVTGTILFSVNAVEYAANPAFLTKLALLAVGIVNAVVLHARSAWRVALEGREVPISVKLTAGVSIAIWLSALVAGRWIGFI